MSVKDPWRQTRTDQRSLSGQSGAGVAGHTEPRLSHAIRMWPLNTDHQGGRQVSHPPRPDHPPGPSGSPTQKPLPPGSPSLRSLSSRPATGLTSCPEDASDDIPTRERGSWFGFGGPGCTAVWCPHPCPSVLLSHVSTTAPQGKTCDGFQINTRDLSSSWMQPQSRQAPKARLL